MEISFRPLAEADVPQIVRWLRDPDVERWWWDVGEKSDEELTEQWTRRAVSPSGRTDRYVIVVDGVDLGIIQTAVLDAYPAYAAEVGVANAAGVDVFIGDAGWRGRGLGTALIRAFIEEIVFSMPGIETCTIDPEPENTRAIRCYEKVGFRHVRTYHSEEDDVDTYLMRLEREVFSA